MTDDLIREATQLMNEQAGDYALLNHACEELCQALTHGQPAAISLLTRGGEAELFKMRARLVRIVRTLTAFADARAAHPESSSISPDVRVDFEAASGNLLRAARQFQRIRERAAALTLGGSTFATACIQVCGIKPTTYKGPYARNGEARPWV
jgi:hypothetical protein